MRRKFSVFIVAFIFTVSMTLPFAPVAFAADAWDGSSVNTAWYDDHMGDTTYTISTGAELAGLAVLVNEGDTATSDTPVDFYGKTINLGDDIDLAGNQWTPIGNATDYFNGTFDGGGHTVSGVAIGTAESPSSVWDYNGLFGRAYGESHLKDLNVNGSVYVSYTGGMTAGVLCGECDSTITGCTATGHVEADGANGTYAGVLVGTMPGDVSDCHASGTAVCNSSDGGFIGGLGGAINGSASGCSADVQVTGGCYAGGLAGFGQGPFTGCWASGDVETTLDAASTPFTICVGGLAGFYSTAASGVADGCHASGSVSASAQDAHVGGLIGNCSWYSSTYTGTVQNCYATGDVNATGTDAYAGGFAGYTDSGYTLDACYATGDVTGKGGSYTGGFTGENGSLIERCFASGDVSGGGDSSAGGFVGWNGGIVNDSYAAGAVWGNTGSLAGGFAGKNYSAISKCYARGAVSGDSLYMGGFAGYNDMFLASIDKCYFDTQGTRQANGIGVDYAPPSDVTGLLTEEMTGSAASGNMTELDFSTVWATKANEQYKWYYPQLAVLEGSGDDTVRAASLASVTKSYFKVSFDSNGGSAVTDEYAYFAAADKPADPTKSGYTFGGWYSDPGLTTAYDFSTAVESDMTLYAKWTENSTPATQVTPGTLTLYVGGRAVLTPAVPGGTWQWDPAYIDLHHSEVTVTALKPGHTVIHYTIGWASADIPVTILAGGMPQTGQDSMPVYILIVLAGCALAGGLLIVRHRKKAKE